MPALRKSRSASGAASDQRLRVSSDIMRALAHPLRMRVLSFIDSNEDACVSAIHTGLGLEQSLVSQHLRILRQAGLVFTRRRGKFVYYALNYERLEGAARTASAVKAFSENAAAVEEVV
jgi:DNA-binding transcriptional ArsR family regulator